MGDFNGFHLTGLVIFASGAMAILIRLVKAVTPWFTWRRELEIRTVILELADKDGKVDAGQLREKLRV